MKKYWLPAVALASGSAFAQSNVVLYGITDVYVGSAQSGLSTTSNGAPSNATQSQGVVNSGGFQTSRWGFRGDEDLGGGLKANFQIETTLLADVGATQTAGAFGDRESWVGLSGRFGAFKLGRTYTPQHTFRASLNNTANAPLGTTTDVFKAVGGDFTNNKSNQLLYVSPNLGGVTGSLSYSLGENKTATTPSYDTVSLYVRYDQGPLSAGYSFQKEEAAAGDSKYHYWGGAYDFGVARVIGGFQQTKRPATTFGTTEEREYTLGVQAPIGATTVYLGYASAKGENAAGATTEKASGFNALVLYSLSKRTGVYVAYKKVTEKNGAGTTQGKLETTVVGLRHTF